MGGRILSEVLYVYMSTGTPSGLFHRHKHRIISRGIRTGGVSTERRQQSRRLKGPFGDRGRNMVRSESTLGIVSGLQAPNGKPVASEGAGVNRASKNASPALARAVSLHLDGQLSAALKHLREALETDKSQPVLYRPLVTFCANCGSLKRPRQNYSKLLELEPEHRSAHFNRGVCLAG